MDCSVGIGGNKGRARSSGRGGKEGCKCKGGQTTALLTRVPGYTTSLTMLEVATMSELNAT